MSEAKIQSNCVKRLWNEYPQTRGCFFAVKNEGAKLSSKAILAAMYFIVKNLNNPASVKKKVNEVISMCKKGNGIGGAIDKAMGVVSGVSDTIFLWQGTAHLLEFKTETGKQSPDQKRWEAKVTEQGLKYYVVRSEAQFMEIISGIITA